MVVKKKIPVIYLDVTKPNSEGNFYLLNQKNKVVGEVPAKEYLKNPDKFMNDEIMPIQYTGWREKKDNKSKAKRCKCK